MFYKIAASFNDIERLYSVRDNCILYEAAVEVAGKSEEFFCSCGQSCYLFAVKKKERKLIFAAITNAVEDMETMFWKYEKTLPLQVKNVRIEEITYKEWSGLLRIAERTDFIGAQVNVTELFGLGGFDGQVKEYLLERVATREKMLETAKRQLVDATLGPELERIYMGGNNKRRAGHPVHYLIWTDDFMVSESIYKTLLAALLANGRIKSKRYCVVDYRSGNGFSREAHDAVYQSCENGAVIVRYQDDKSGEMRYSRGKDDIVINLCETVMKYKNKVLTILLLPTECSKIKDEFFAKMGTTVFVELYEDIIFGEEAERYLKLKAKEHRVCADKKLVSMTADREKGFCAAELDRMFDEWYDYKLRFTIYPQYKEIASVKQQIGKENSRGSAVTRLQELIGISQAKKVMEQAINFYRAQKIFADRGMKSNRPSMHMVFTGNPGTAKTTVARIFAQIMKENRMLSRGELYEVGRADIIGQYVGQTAPLVKRAFHKAKGGVLFIDEAYSLMDGEDGLYGDEAINTIVQEMENHREDTVVIFAGYPDKMEQFLQKNPGLRSRIAFHIPFEDYTVEELCQIAEFVARDKEIELSEGAMEKLRENFSLAMRFNDFGNGRYVRNIIERAMMAQANRLMKKDVNTVSDRDIVTICAEDIEIFSQSKVETRRIGFA